MHLEGNDITEDGVKLLEEAILERSNMANNKLCRHIVVEFQGDQTMV